MDIHQLRRVEWRHGAMGRTRAWHWLSRGSVRLEPGSVDRVKHALRADDVAVKAVPTRQDALRQVEIVAEPGERDDRDLAGLEVRISLVNLVERRD